ncbi:MAG: PEP/pyruvate-binding domain-containing protein [Bacteroidota bacterium]
MIKNLAVRSKYGFLFGTMWLSVILVYGQPLYNGHVFDAATGEDLVDVEISLFSQGVSTFSNDFGDFVLNSEEGNILAGNYQFFHNTLIWNTDQSLNIRLVALDGSTVFYTPDVGISGTFLFPRLSYGIYILQLSTDQDKQAFKLFSNGSQTYMVDPHSDRYNGRPSQGQDTLLISKAGYFSREIVLSGTDTVLNIGMLSGNFEELDYFLQLVAPVAFDLLSSEPSRTHAADVRSVKIIYDEKQDLMYYMNSKRHRLHYFFARDFLDFRQGHAVFNNTQYVDNPNRYLYPANINYYEGIDTYVLHLVAANQMSCEHLYRLYEKLLQTSYFGDKLVFFANKSDWDACTDIPTISSEELFAGQNYQALNLTENYGYLTQVKLEELEDTYLSRREIVLLDGIPNDVSVVAGIITTEFQTPLSHINVLSNSRGTPNMALKDGWTHPTLTALLGQLVYLNVRADSFEIRAASLEEATQFWSQNEPQTPIFPAKNTELDGLVDLRSADYSFVDRIGGKAANFSEILKVDGDPAIPTPEASFAIPFHYYQAHIEQSGLDVHIAQLLQDTDFLHFPSIRQAKLTEIRDSILHTPIDPALVNLVLKKIDYFQEFSAFRFRSSTNAEDLEGFSGAGLYSSHSAKKGHQSKTVENAIRKVWASLWNWRAFEERSYFKIDHESCAMGILVHRSFPDEDANGVLVTRNLYNPNPGFIINVQYKEYSIVFPEPGVLHDQIMLMAWSVTPGQNFMIEYLTVSNIPELNGQRVMTDEELQELGDYAMRVKQRFYEHVPNNCNCPFKEFALDIEFKLDSEVSPRKIYLKQARPFR